MAIPPEFKGIQAHARLFCGLSTCGKEVEWLGAVKDGRDEDGKPLVFCCVEHQEEYRKPRCKKCGAALPPWNERDGMIQCEACLTLHGAPPPRR